MRKIIVPWNAECPGCGKTFNPNNDHVRIVAVYSHPNLTPAILYCHLDCITNTEINTMQELLFNRVPYKDIKIDFHDSDKILHAKSALPEEDESDF